MSGYTTIAQAAKDLMNRPRKRFLVPGILPIGVSILYGGSGAGKTGLAVNLSIAVASGSSFLEQQIDPGGVLYVAAEDYEGVKERLIAASFATDHEPEDLKISIVERPKDALTSEAGKDIILAEAGRLVAEAQTKVRLIVVDTLAASFGEKSQDDASYANAFMNNLETISRSMGCAVLAVHHTAKSDEGKPQAKMRGSQAFFDRADCVISVTAGAGSASKPTGRMPKIRNGSKGDLSFEYRIDGYPLETCDGEISTQFVTDITLRSAGSDQADPTAKPEKEPTRPDKAFQVLLSVMGEHKDVPVSVWRTALEDHFIKHEGAKYHNRRGQTQRDLWREVQKKLIDDGKISISDDFVSVLVSEKNHSQKDSQERREECVSECVSSPPLRGGTLTHTQHHRARIQSRKP